jgi:hypothetical protein
VSYPVLSCYLHTRTELRHEKAEPLCYRLDCCVHRRCARFAGLGSFEGDGPVYGHGAGQSRAAAHAWQCSGRQPKGTPARVSARCLLRCCGSRGSLRSLLLRSSGLLRILSLPALLLSHDAKASSGGSLAFALQITSVLSARSPLAAQPCADVGLIFPCVDHKFPPFVPTIFCSLREHLSAFVHGCSCKDIKRPSPTQEAER